MPVFCATSIVCPTYTQGKALLYVKVPKNVKLPQIDDDVLILEISQLQTVYILNLNLF